jgi:subtilase family serine protease
VEWAHALAPDANILVVEATSDDSDDLLNAVDYAVNSGANVVSMSWGSSENNMQTRYDSHFSTKNGTVFVAAAGDDGAAAEWPASSTKVISVGGTTLNLDTNGNIQSETAWSGSGGGYSRVESEPSWQNKFGVNTNSRATPDVAFDADTNTGASVYCSIEYKGASGWYKVGGTSLGAPSWAAIISDLNQNTTYIKNASEHRQQLQRYNKRQQWLQSNSRLRRCHRTWLTQCNKSCRTSSGKCHNAYK